MTNKEDIQDWVRDAERVGEQPFAAGIVAAAVIGILAVAL